MTGVSSGVVLGLLLGRSPRAAEIAGPFVGVVLSAGIQRMQAYLLRWQPQYQPK